MREIKFRAWDIELKVMRYRWINLTPDSSHAFAYGKNDEDLEGANEDIQRFFPFSTGQVMQYTGLKDRNGTEIYEGDIIEFEEPRFESEMIKAPVIFHAGSFVTDGSETFTLGDYPEYQWEVIGNIYEKTELLS